MFSVVSFGLLLLTVALDWGRSSLNSSLLCQSCNRFIWRSSAHRHMGFPKEFPSKCKLPCTVTVVIFLSWTRPGSLSGDNRCQSWHPDPKSLQDLVLRTILSSNVTLASCLLTACNQKQSLGDSGRGDLIAVCVILKGPS